MRFPDFLIIGAMKSGTTTLYYDLLPNPEVYLPTENKEPHALVQDTVFSKAGLEEYAAYFAKARRDQICGEASTGYSKIPQHQRVPDRAMEICGRGVRIVYIVRDPIARIISHHHHRYTGQGAPIDINIDAMQCSEYIDVSSYAKQIEPWINMFGREQVCVVTFESYVRDRRSTIEEVSRFLGVTPRPDLVDDGKAYNKTEGKAVYQGLWAFVCHSKLYRSGIRPLLPLRLKDSLRESLLPKSALKPMSPAPETVEKLLEKLWPEVERLRVLLGEDEPRWTLEDLCSRHLRAANEESASREAIGVEPGPESGV